MLAAIGSSFSRYLDALATNAGCMFSETVRDRARADAMLTVPRRLEP